MGGESDRGCDVLGAGLARTGAGLARPARPPGCPRPPLTFTPFVSLTCRGWPAARHCGRWYWRWEGPACHGAGAGDAWPGRPVTTSPTRAAATASVAPHPCRAAKGAVVGLGPIVGACAGEPFWCYAWCESRSRLGRSNACRRPRFRPHDHSPAEHAWRRRTDDRRRPRGRVASQCAPTGVGCFAAPVFLVLSEPPSLTPSPARVQLRSSVLRTRASRAPLRRRHPAALTAGRPVAGGLETVAGRPATPDPAHVGFWAASVCKPFRACK